MNLLPIIDDSPWQFGKRAFCQDSGTISLLSASNKQGGSPFGCLTSLGKGVKLPICVFRRRNLNQNAAERGPRKSRCWNVDCGLFDVRSAAFFEAHGGPVAFGPAGLSFPARHP